MLVPVEPDPGRQGEQGTVFIVVVAVIMLVSTLLVLGVGGFRLLDNGDRVRNTVKRQEFLIRELAAYVQRTNALPCPADPAIDPMSRDFGFARVSCGIYQSDGIVPFRTLNLSEHDARDGWDRFMTYKISPVLADTNKGNSIFMRCRRFPVVRGRSAAAREGRQCVSAESPVLLSARRRVLSARDRPAGVRGGH